MAARQHRECSRRLDFSWIENKPIISNPLPSMEGITPNQMTGEGWLTSRRLTIEWMRGIKRLRKDGSASANQLRGVPAQPVKRGRQRRNMDISITDSIVRRVDSLIVWSPSPIDMLELSVVRRVDQLLLPVWSPSPLDTMQDINIIHNSFPLGNLPSEILEMIFKMCSIRDCLNVAQSAKKFYGIINNCSFWEFRLFKDHKCTTLFKASPSRKLQLLKETYEMLDVFPVTP